MRGLILSGCLAMTACAPIGGSALRQNITTNDMLVNRPNTNQEEALFSLQSGSTGTVTFVGRAADPQDITWTLAGNTFCIETNEGIMSGFGCAQLQLNGTNITLSHTESDGVATGRLVGR